MEEQLHHPTRSLGDGYVQDQLVQPLGKAVHGNEVAAVTATGSVVAGQWAREAMRSEGVTLGFKFSSHGEFQPFTVTEVSENNALFMSGGEESHRAAIQNAFHQRTGFDTPTAGGLFITDDPALFDSLYTRLPDADTCITLGSETPATPTTAVDLLTTPETATLLELREFCRGFATVVEMDATAQLHLRDLLVLLILNDATGLPELTDYLDRDKHGKHRFLTELNTTNITCPNTGTPDELVANCRSTLDSFDTSELDPFRDFIETGQDAGLLDGSGTPLISAVLNQCRILAITAKPKTTSQPHRHLFNRLLINSVLALKRADSANLSQYTVTYHTSTDRDAPTASHIATNTDLIHGTPFTTILSTETHSIFTEKACKAIHDNFSLHLSFGQESLIAEELDDVSVPDYQADRTDDSRAIRYVPSGEPPITTAHIHPPAPRRRQTDRNH